MAPVQPLGLATTRGSRHGRRRSYRRQPNEATPRTNLQANYSSHSDSTSPDPLRSWRHEIQVIHKLDGAHHEPADVRSPLTPDQLRSAVSGIVGGILAEDSCRTGLAGPRSVSRRSMLG